MIRCVNGLLLAALLTVLLSGGCVTDDPKQGGFIGGVIGLSSGNYQRNVEERQTRLAAIQSIGRDLTAEQQQLKAKNASLQMRIKAQQNALKRLDAEVAKLEQDARQIHAATASDAQQQRAFMAQIDSIQTRIAALKRETSTTASSPELEALQKQFHNLEQEAEQLWAAYQALL